MHVAKRFGRETYPSSFGASALSQMPFVQLGLSGDVAFVEGVQRIIPFNTVIYEAGDLGGNFELVGADSVFFVPFGFYLVVLQADVDTNTTDLSAGVNVQSGSGVDASAATSIQGAIGVTVSAPRLGSETPFPLHVLPVGILPALQANDGGNGVITAAFTKLFVWQLARFPAVTT